MTKDKDAPVRDLKKGHKRKDSRYSNFETDRGRAGFQWFHSGLAKELEKEERERKSK